MRCPLFSVALGIVLCGCGAAGYGQTLNFDIVPEVPTVSTPVSIWTWIEFGDPSQRLVSASHEIDEDEIIIDVTMQDLPLSPIPVAIPGGGWVHCGLLPAGSYHVSADMWMIPWGSDEPEYFCSGSTSFTVVPEPASLILLASGAGAVAAFRRHRRNGR